MFPLLKILSKMHIFIFGYKIDVCCLQCIFISSFPIGTQFRKWSFFINMSCLWKQALRLFLSKVLIAPQRWATRIRRKSWKYWKTQWLSDLLHDSRLWNDSIILCHNGAKYTAQALDTLIIKVTPSFPFHSWSKQNRHWKADMLHFT